jgi:hypothetical protein
MSILRKIWVVGILINFVALAIYIGYRFIECAAPILSKENFIVVLVFLFAFSSYLIINLAEDVEFMKVPDDNEEKKFTGIRGVINTPRFAYRFLAAVGITGVFSFACMVFLELSRLANQ